MSPKFVAFSIDEKQKENETEVLDMRKLPRYLIRIIVVLLLIVGLMLFADGMDRAPVFELLGLIMAGTGLVISFITGCWHCPHCGGFIGRHIVMIDYCPHCGKKLDP